MLILLVACSAPPDPEGTRPGPSPLDTRATITTTTDPSTSVGDTSVPLPPMIDVALLDRCPDPTPPPVVPPGDDLHRVTLAGVGRCNDGTPPVVYVRAATDPAHAEDWVVHFDGGSFCASHESCAVRWCGEGFYDAGKMSTKWHPATQGGQGISSPSPQNAYAGWNQARVAFCSSDWWQGTGADVVMTPRLPDTGQAPPSDTPPYRMHFEGRLIAVDVVDALAAGLTSDDGVETLEPLAGARNVVVSGSSAGTNGALTAVDDIAAAAVAAETLLVLDSNFFGTPEDMTPEAYALMDVSLQELWQEVQEPLWRTHLDPACAAAHAADPWRCTNQDVLLREGYAQHATLLHHDLADPVLLPTYLGFGLSHAEFALLGEAVYRRYVDELPQATLHASNCGVHTILDGGGFRELPVVDAVAGGPAWSVHDALGVTIDGGRVVAIDTAPAVGSTCD